MKLHLDSFILRLLHAKEREDSRRFFANNAQRIDSVCAFLQDEKPCAVLRAAIRFRQTYTRKDAPLYTKEQYFPLDVVSLTDQEVFVDCGAFTGDTVGLFVTACSNQFSSIICFEPDASNFSVLNRTLIDDRIVKIQSGVWNEESTLTFVADKGAGSTISTETTTTTSVHVVAIDGVQACQKATFIKMDIEGAERNALKGAAEVIRRNRPKLAISIYHSNEEMLGIPEYLHSTLEDYSFHVRHHSLNWQDTVLYAIPN